MKYQDIPFYWKVISSSRAVKILFLSFTCEDIGVAVVTNMISQLQESFPLRHVAGSHVSPRSHVISSISYYIISSVMHAFWLVLTNDLLEDRRIDDVIIKTFSNSLLYKTNRFQVAVRLFIIRSQKTSKCSKNISDTLGCASCATFLFLLHFDVLCDVLLNRRRATRNLFVKFMLWLRYIVLIIMFTFNSWNNL